MSKLFSSPPFTTELSPALLIQAVQEVSVAETIEAIIAIVTRTARTGTGADGVSFVLRDGDKCFYVEEDSIAPLWKGRNFPMSECVSGWCMLHRQAVAIPDISLDLRVPESAYRPTFVRSLVMVPIRSQAPIGAIGAYWASNHQTTPEAVHWLQALADATSAGIEAVRAAEEVEALRRSASFSPFPDQPREVVRMCAWTKRFQHNGQWMSIEAYLRSRFGIEVTHGMSDDAFARFKQEIDSVMGGKHPPAEA